ncbi:MAG: hypothetical protein J7J42_06065 [Thermoplasmata archaeon]|nr:hypothetical protein [Thermoplasmata archaeon]
MSIFITDLLAGILLVLSLLFLIISIIAYRRYRIGILLLTSVAFLLFLFKAIIYELNIYFEWDLQILQFSFLMDVIILIALYASVVKRG